MDLEALIDYAAGLGVGVEWVGTVAGFSGAADVAGGRVFLDRRLQARPRYALGVLAHELGHVQLGHECAQDVSGERAANRYAARLLVSPAEYALAERLYGPAPALIAHELGVPVFIVAAYRELAASDRARIRSSPAC